jgi:hypothetical protein
MIPAEPIEPKRGYDNWSWSLLLGIAKLLPSRFLVACVIRAWSRATSRTDDDVWFDDITMSELLERLA